jgi:hypothetical protein
MNALKRDFEMEPKRPSAKGLLIALALTLTGCATSMGHSDQLTQPQWTSEPYGTTAMLPDNFKLAPLFIDESPWPALSEHFRAALSAQGATLTTDPAKATYRLRLDGSYRAVAPNNATASASLEVLAKNATPAIGPPPAAGVSSNGYIGRSLDNAISASVGYASMGVPNTLGNFGVALGLSAAFESLASATGAREKLQAGIAILTGVPASTPLFCGSAETCENIRLMAHNLTQQVILSVDIYRGEEKLLRRTARADGYSKEPSVDQGFDLAVKELAALTLKE